jgi:hypothetical protein
MRSLAERKTRLVFETADVVHECGHDRQVAVEAHPGYAVVRLKGTRQGYCISYGAIYHAAVRLTVQGESGPRKATRKRGAR